MHTERTQNAHTQHRIQNTEQQYNNMQHIEQNTENNTEHKIQNTEQNTEHSTQNSAHNYRTYSLDYYQEFAYIKNSDTIEIYTLSK